MLVFGIIVEKMKFIFFRILYDLQNLRQVFIDLQNEYC
jgi:hypothetical protein